MLVSTFFCVHTLDEQQTVVYNICSGCNCLSIDKFKGHCEREKEKESRGRK
jgi:hypothetical protein